MAKMSLEMDKKISVTTSPIMVLVSVSTILYVIYEMWITRILWTHSPDFCINALILSMAIL